MRCSKIGKCKEHGMRTNKKKTKIMKNEDGLHNGLTDEKIEKIL